MLHNCNNFMSCTTFQNWKQWREDEIDKDIEFCHPRWPEEKMYLVQEKKELDKMRPQYFSDFWYDTANKITILESYVMLLSNFINALDV